MAVLTITLNPAIDATYLVEGYRHGGANRVIRRHEMPGGKGNNVARVLRLLGEEVTATGFVGGETGGRIVDGLRQHRVTTQFTELASGESRTCHTILEADTGIATEVLEAGPKVSKADCDRFLRSLPELLRWAHVAVVSGSMPPDTHPTFVKTLANALRQRGSWSHRQAPGPLAVDASGQTLHQLLEGKPDILKPNEDEIEHLMGAPAKLPEQVRFLQEDLIPSRLAPGARVILSRGRDGAVLVTGDAVIQARPPAVDVVNTVGCGDALLAGFVRAWLNDTADEVALCEGVATGTAAALEEVAGVVNPRHVARLQKEVEVTHGIHIA